MTNTISVTGTVWEWLGVFSLLLFVHLLIPSPLSYFVVIAGCVSWMGWRYAVAGEKPIKVIAND